MSAPLEVFADITCPFTHVGLKQVVRHVSEMDEPIDVIVRAWPLEWVNGVALDAEVVATKSCVIADQLDVDYFSGVNADHWPASTIPALNLVASAYHRDAATGLAVSLELREALFERGVDVGDMDVLTDIAAAYDLPVPGVQPCDAVRGDYEAGLAREVKGSPHFWVGQDDFFCPALDIGHDDEGHLTARFDQAKLADFFQRIDT
jgi:predicted DsbA family dithiol-disulfide isomerase